MHYNGDMWFLLIVSFCVGWDAPMDAGKGNELHLWSRNEETFWGWITVWFSIWTFQCHYWNYCRNETGERRACKKERKTERHGKEINRP